MKAFFGLLELATREPGAAIGWVGIILVVVAVVVSALALAFRISPRGRLGFILKSALAAASVLVLGVGAFVAALVILLAVFTGLGID